MLNMSDFIDTCREKGLHATYQRFLVYKTLRQSQRHPTAEDIYHEIKMEYPSISLATVYKTLEILAEHDLVGKVTPLHDLARYDGDISRHHHLVCLRCRKIVDIHDDSFNRLKLPAQQDFQVSGYRIQFEGLCRECLQQEHPSAAGMETALSGRE